MVPKSAQNRIGTTFAPHIASEDQFNENVFIDSGQIIGVLGKSLHFFKEENNLREKKPFKGYLNNISNILYV